MKKYTKEQLEFLKELNHDPKDEDLNDILEQLGAFDNNVENFEDILNGIHEFDGYNHQMEIGEYMVDNGMIGEVPKHLEYYIDYEAIGRDTMHSLAYNDTYWSFYF